MLCEGESYLNLYHPGSDSDEIIFCKMFMPFLYPCFVGEGRKRMASF